MLADFLRHPCNPHQPDDPHFTSGGIESQRGYVRRLLGYVGGKAKTEAEAGGAPH